MSAATQQVRIGSPATRLCIKCHRAPIHGKSEKARYCADCIGRQHAQKRGNPPKWIPTENIDRIIREHYMKRLENGGHPRSLPTLEQIGKKIGWPKFAVTQRARKLGLSRVKESPWSEEEIKLLERYSYLTPARIGVHFARNGFNRTAAAINLQIKRKHLRSTHEFYSATNLAALFGCDGHLVTRWIRLGYLKAKRRGTERGAKCGGDEYLLKDEWVRDFVLSHPIGAFDIRKVDQLWFLNMLMQGKLCPAALPDGRTFK